jgi:hypothetical protein
MVNQRNDLSTTALGRTRKSDAPVKWALFLLITSTEALGIMTDSN